MDQIHFDDLVLASGIRLRYGTRGDESGVPCVFLHGYTDAWHSFAPVLTHLPAARRALVPDQRGHGDSDRPDAGYAIGDFAADVIALLDGLGVARAHLAGHSMGSFVAQRVALDHPDRVARLVLIGSAGTLDNPGMRELHEAVHQLTAPIDREFVHAFQTSTAATPLPEAFLARTIADSLKVPLRVWQAVADQLLAVDHRGALDRIRAPTLILGGDQDGLFSPADQAALAAAIPGATLTLYEGVGHAAHWERPAQVARDIEAFLAGAPD